MSKSESIGELYSRIDYKNAKDPTGRPHINVFERTTCSVQIPYSRRDYYKITLIIGKGRIEYADHTIEIDRPALMFSNPLIPYAWIPVSKKQSGWFCIFNDAFVKMQDHLLTDLPVFQPGKNHLFYPDANQIKIISSLFDKMMIENQICYHYKMDVLRCYLHLIIHEGLKLQPNNRQGKSTNASSRIAGLFLELLERQFPVDSMQNSLKLTTAKNYAEQLSIHVNHLNRSVKEVTGKTTTAHISDRIILEAQALIRYSNWNISEIAYSLGFEYPAHFTSFYKKKTGMSPTLLKKENV